MSLPMRSPANSMEVLLLRLGIALGMLKGDGPGRLLAACGPGNSQKTPSLILLNDDTQGWRFKLSARGRCRQVAFMQWYYEF